MIKNIISGGQTGADQAGLDVAIKNGIPHGGAIPKGCMTEDGVLDSKYNLEEMSTKSYPKRTEKNVVDSDGTVILTHGELTGGSLLTRKKAIQHNKPVLHLDMSKMENDEAVGLLTAFIEDDGIGVLNVAGSRASKDPEIYDKTFDVVDESIRLAVNEYFRILQKRKQWQSAVVDLFTETKKPSGQEMYDVLREAGVEDKEAVKCVEDYHQLAYALANGVPYHIAGYEAWGVRSIKKRT